MKNLCLLLSLPIFLAGTVIPVTKDAMPGSIKTQTEKQADTTSLNGQWFLQPLLTSDTAAGKIPVLRFNLAASTFTGTTGCNTMRGSFQKKDSSLVFNQNIMTTKMFCAGYDEAAFLKNLLRANSYKLEKNVLVLMFDATELSRWTRKPDRKVKMKTV